MKNISFDNPYLLLLAIPILLLVLIPYFLIRNKDNRSVGWLMSLALHVVIVITVVLAAAGLSTSSVMTKTTVYALCDLSYSTDRSHAEIDGYIKDIEESLPENSTLGIVCFGRDYSILTMPGRDVKSVSEAKIDESGTDIAGALTYTAGLFKGDTLKRIILITDGNDTESESYSSIAQAVENVTESGIRVDAIFLDTALKEGEGEIQLISAEHSETTYLSGLSEARFVIRASEEVNTVLTLYVRPLGEDGMPTGEYEPFAERTVIADSGLNTVKIPLKSDTEGAFEYKAVISSDSDVSEHNNERTFTQRVVGSKRILLVTGSHSDEALLRAAYGESADIDAYTVPGGSVPVTIDEMIGYDEIIISNLDIRSVRNANAFIDTVSVAVSKYGKSLITLGNLELHTNSDDATFKKFEELLPLDFGATGVDGRLYTIVLDASDSMFMASKFSIARDAAIKLLSIIEDDDYVSLVTFAGAINVKPPKKAGEYKDELIDYINGLKTSHGTDMALGLEEALAAVKTLNRAHNQVVVISDGFSFDSERRATEVAADLAAEGAVITAINTYVSSDGSQSGRAFMKNMLAAADQSKNYYEISTTDQVSGVIFGDMAEDLADVIIEKDSRVNVAKPNDSVLNGLPAIKTVSGYVLSVAKYDAVAPLTVTYLKSNNYQETVPLYAYRSHGNGRVASLATSLTGAWAASFSDTERAALLSNIIESNTPIERIDRPFTLEVTEGGTEAYFELLPAKLDPSATASMRIVYPNGRIATRTMTNDGSRFFTTLETVTTGVYRITVTYKCESGEYSYSTLTEVAYLPEYDMFTGADRYNVFRFMRDNGEVTEGEIPSMENLTSELTLYRQSYIVPLLIIAAALFVLDVAVRKMRKSKKTGRRERA